MMLMIRLDDSIGVVDLVRSCGTLNPECTTYEIIQCPSSRLTFAAQNWQDAREGLVKVSKSPFRDGEQNPEASEWWKMHDGLQ